MTKNKTKFRAVNYWKAVKLVNHKIKPYIESGYAWRLQYSEHRPIIFRRKDLRLWKSLKFFREIQYKSIEW